MVVLDTNCFTCPVNDIKDIEALRTIVGGGLFLTGCIDRRPAGRFSICPYHIYNTWLVRHKNSTELLTMVFRPLPMARDHGPLQPMVVVPKAD